MSGVAVAAMGTLVVSTGMAGLSVAQMIEQQKRQRQLDRSASKLMEDTRKKIEVKYTEAMDVQKNIYEQARDSLLQTATRGVEAGVEGETRGAAATVGRVVTGVGQQELGITAAQEGELQGIQKAQIDESQALRNMGVQLNLGEIEGIQKASSESQAMAERAKAQAITSVGSIIQTGLGLVPTFVPDANARQSATLAAADQIQLTPNQISQLEGMPGYQGIETNLTLEPGEQFATTTETMESFDPSKLGGMTKQQFKQFEGILTPQQLGQIRGSETYKQAYTPTLFGMQIDPFALDYMRGGIGGKTNMDAAQLALLKKLLQ